MKVLVTGGSGYVGTELIRTLVTEEQVSQVVIYDNLSRANYNLFLGKKFENYEKIIFIEGDILDSWKLKNTLTDIDIFYDQKKPLIQIYYKTQNLKQNFLRKTFIERR